MPAARRRPAEAHPAGGAQPGLLVTIDGPAGVGKSSIGAALAKRLDADFLDTGAMYRTAAALALDAGVAPEDGEGIAALIHAADLRFDFADDPPTLYAAGKALSARLREEEVSRLVSPVSALAPVREALVELQRAIGAQRRRLVSEGRDQGSVVFPHADVKLYLDARPDVRARRRAEQIRAAGREANEAQIERAISARDVRDSTRAVGPLIKPSDAVVVDTSDMTFDEVVDALERIVCERAAASGKGS